MRGKVADDPVDARDYRITPAHAGKRGFRDYGVEKGTDHPRACGEKSLDE